MATPLDFRGNTIYCTDIVTGVTATSDTGNSLSSTELGVLDGATSANSTTGKVAILGTSGAVTFAGAVTATSGVTTPAGVVTKSGTAVPATAGAVAAGAPITMFSTGIKIWVTSDAPTHTATKGDLCINTGGSSSSTRLYVNNGTTTWIAVTTAS